MRNLTLTALTLLAMALAGCKKEEAERPDLGYGYFPRTVGSFIVYQVDSMWVDEPAQVQGSVSYLLKEKVVEEYLDPAGRKAWRIHRFVLDPDSNWVIRDVWTSTWDEIAAEVTEENMRRQKLSFPVREGRRWDINVYNIADELEVAFREVGSAWSGGGLSYDRTVLVKSTVPPNAVITNNFEERWAHGVGMVSKYWEEMNSQVDGDMGWRLDMVAVLHGTE